MFCLGGFDLVGLVDEGLGDEAEHDEAIVGSVSVFGEWGPSEAAGLKVPFHNRAWFSDLRFECFSVLTFGFLVFCREYFWWVLIIECNIRIFDGSWITVSCGLRWVCGRDLVVFVSVVFSTFLSCCVCIGGVFIGFVFWVAGFLGGSWLLGFVFSGSRRFGFIYLFFFYFFFLNEMNVKIEPLMLGDVGCELLK